MTDELTQADFVSKDDYAMLMGELSAIWQRYGGTGTNMDVLIAIAETDGLPLKSKIYAAFIHGIEVAPQYYKEDITGTQTQVGDDTGSE